MHSASLSFNPPVWGSHRHNRHPLLSSFISLEPHLNQHTKESECEYLLRRVTAQQFFSRHCCNSRQQQAQTACSMTGRHELALYGSRTEALQSCSSPSGWQWWLTLLFQTEICLRPWRELLKKEKKKDVSLCKLRAASCLLCFAAFIHSSWHDTSLLSEQNKDGVRRTAVCLKAAWYCLQLSQLIWNRHNVCERDKHSVLTLSLPDSAGCQTETKFRKLIKSKTRRNHYCITNWSRSCWTSARFCRVQQRTKQTQNRWK